MLSRRAAIAGLSAALVASAAEAGPKKRRKRAVKKAAAAKPSDAEAYKPKPVPMIVLVVGQKQAVTLPKLARATSANPHVADINHLGGGKIEVQAKAPGTAELRLFDSTGSLKGYVIKVKRADEK